MVDEGADVEVVVSTGKPDVEVPGVVGKSEQEATDQLEAAGFKVNREERDTDDPEGEVIDQNPAAGEPATSGSEVTIFVADGPETIPGVVGMSEDEATAAIDRKSTRLKSSH